MIGVNLAGAEFGKLGGPHGGYPDNGIPGYIYPSLDVLKAYARVGINFIRLPFMWERMQAEPNAPLVPAELALMKLTLANAATAGLKVMPDCHNSCRFKGQIATPEMLASLWSQLAFEMKGFSALEAYDIQNEPHDMAHPRQWFDMAAATIPAIRQHDTARKIHIAGDGWSGAWRWHEVSTHLIELKDIPNAGPLVFHAHQYLDPNGSGTYSVTDFGTTNPDIGVQRLKPFVDWCNANNVEGFIGEFGVPGHKDARWLEAQKRMLDYMVANKIGGTVWAGGAWWPSSYPLFLGSVGMPNANLEQVASYAAVPVPPVVTVPTDLRARLDKARLEVNDLRNTAARALYAIDRAIEGLG